MAGWGVIDDFLGAVNLLDWLQGLVKGAMAGDVVGHRIALPVPDSEFWETNQLQPWSLNEMRDLLASYHIETFGRGFNSEEIWAHCKQEQARFAEYLLLRAGCPVLMDTVDERNAGWANDPKHGGLMPARWDDRERHSPPDWAEREG